MQRHGLGPDAPCEPRRFPCATRIRVLRPQQYAALMQGQMNQMNQMNMYFGQGKAWWLQSSF